MIITPIPLLPSKTAAKARSRAPYYQRKVRCPAHYLLPPHIDVWLREPVPLLSGVSKSACITYGVKKTRIKRDRWGRKMLDWKKIYDLARQGIVLQPEKSASFLIEHVYDPLSPICQTKFWQKTLF